MKLRLEKVLLLALTVSGTQVSHAADTAQQVVTSVSYQLTEYDTSKTGRQRAIEKLKQSALSEADTEYLSITKMDLDSGITETKSTSVGRVTDMQILSEGLVTCSNKQSARCYSIKAEVTVSTARIAPTQKAVDSRISALEMSKAMEELF